MITESDSFYTQTDTHEYVKNIKCHDMNAYAQIYAEIVRKSRQTLNTFGELTVAIQR